MSYSTKKRPFLLGAVLGVLAAGASIAGLGLITGSVTAAGAAAPNNTSPPTISGTTLRGEVMHSDPGSWTGTKPISFAYQWQRCSAKGASCSDIGGAKDRDYRLTSADVGRTVRVVVKASNSSGSSTAASSPSAVVAAPQVPANSAPPQVIGNPLLGQTLTVNPGTWVGPQPITLTYQWWRCDHTGAACV